MHHDLGFCRLIWSPCLQTQPWPGTVAPTKALSPHRSRRKRDLILPWSPFTCQVTVALPGAATASWAGGERPPGPRSSAQPSGSVLHPQPVSRPQDGLQFGGIWAHGKQQPLKPAGPGAPLSQHHHAAPGSILGGCSQPYPQNHSCLLQRRPCPLSSCSLCSPTLRATAFPGHGPTGHAHHTDLFPSKPAPSPTSPSQYWLRFGHYLQTHSPNS